MRYASKLTESPSLLEAADSQALRAVGWSDEAVWEVVALTSFFNFSGRMEAASGLPPDEIPEHARFAEGRGS